MTGCREMLENAYFSHLFRHFWPKIFFFENPAPSVFRSSKKLPWYQKSENSNEPFEWNLPEGRTDGQTDEGKSIGPYLIGRSKNQHSACELALGRFYIWWVYSFTYYRYISRSFWYICLLLSQIRLCSSQQFSNNIIVNN